MFSCRGNQNTDWGLLRAGTNGGPAYSPIPLGTIDKSIKSEILSTLDKYSRSGELSDESKDTFWNWLVDRLSDYRGKVQAGLPSTALSR